MSVPGVALSAELDAWRPDIVGFSFLSPAAGDATALARHARQTGAVTVAGGPHATICGASLSPDAFDVVVKGDGEHALLDLVAHVEGGAIASGVVHGRTWEDLSAHRTATCPICDGAMEPRYGSGPSAVGGRCRDCRTVLS